MSDENNIEINDGLEGLGVLTGEKNIGLGTLTGKNITVNINNSETKKLITQKEIEIEVNIEEYLPTSIYHLLNAHDNPLVTFIIKAKDKTKHVKITSYIDGYSAKAINTIEVKANTEEKVYQLPTLFPHLITNIREITRVTLHLKVEMIDSNIVKEDSYPISLFSRNSAIFDYYNLRTGEHQFIPQYLGVFVTPNHPEIINFLRTITNFHPKKVLVGYQEKEEAIPQQVRAVFDALKSIELRYTNSIVDSNPNQKFHGHRVRLPRESLKEQQAGTLDGVLLFASLLEACSLNSAIVLIPAHAFLAWERGDDNREWEFLETTMINSNSFDEACEKGELIAKEFQEQDELTILPIKELREKGITPME